MLLTHNHRDHTWPESLLRIHEAFPDCHFVGPAESMANFREHGIADALLTTVTAGDTVELGTMRGHVVWAKPPQGAPEDGIKAPDVDHLGYVVEAGGVRVYVSGDPINTFAEHDELIQPIVALKPDIGFLTTHPDEGEFPYFDGSVKMAMKLGLHTAVPAHYSCFVKRDYDPAEWAAYFPEDGPDTLIIPYKGSGFIRRPADSGRSRRGRTTDLRAARRCNLTAWGDSPASMSDFPVSSTSRQKPISFSPGFGAPVNAA